MHILSISELIEELEKIKAEHGDIPVEITYRDEGTPYYDSTSEFLFEIKTGVTGYDNDQEVLVL